MKDGKKERKKERNEQTKIENIKDSEISNERKRKAGRNN